MSHARDSGVPAWRIAVAVARCRGGWLNVADNEPRRVIPARRARMVLADWQDGRRDNKPGQARGQRQERQRRVDGRRAGRAKKRKESLFSGADPSRQGAGWGGKSGPRSLRNTPLLRELNFWNVSLAQYQWKTASVFSRFNPPFPNNSASADRATFPITIHRREHDSNIEAIERGPSLGRAIAVRQSGARGQRQSDSASGDQQRNERECSDAQATKPAAHS